MSLAPYPWLAASAQLLSSQWQLGRLHHALLLHGTEGLGKGEFAETIANGLLCLTQTNLSHCGQCKACQLLAAGNHPDLMIFDASQQSIGVNEIRQANHFVQQSPLIAQRRVLVIKGLEKMTVGAANAWLKTLEEPPPHGYLLMTSHRLQQLLMTVVSRCFKLLINAGGAQAVYQWLHSCDQSLDIEQFDPLYRLAGEAPLTLLRFLKQDKLAVFTQLQQQLDLWEQGQQSLVNFKRLVIDDEFALATLLFLLHDKLKQYMLNSSGVQQATLLEQINAHLVTFHREARQISGRNQELSLLRLLQQLDSDWQALLSQSVV